jgi:hypothetical protein
MERCLRNLGSAEHHAIQQNFEFLEGSLSWSAHPVFLNGRKDLVVPETGLKIILTENSIKRR